MKGRPRRLAEPRLGRPLREHETLYAALQQLTLRVKNRAEHLRWLSERDVSKGPAVTLLCATPGSLPERTQRALAELKREQPGAAVEVRVPRHGDPAARFSPQWTLRDSAGVARAVIVGDGPTSTQALISELRRAG